MGFENFGGDASRIADDCGEDDGSVYVAPTASTGRRRRGFQDTLYLGRYAERLLRNRRVLHPLQDAGDHISLDSLAVQTTGVEHRHGVRVVTKGREQMLKRNLRCPRCSGKFRTPGKRCGELR